MSNSGEFWRFVRFACVGVGNTAIHVCAVTLLVEVVGIAPPPANALAFALANLSSYFLNAAWTFRRQKNLRSYTRFVLVGLVGLVISWGCVVSTEALGIHYLVGVLGSVFFVASIGYLLNRKFVFND